MHGHHHLFGGHHDRHVFEDTEDWMYHAGRRGGHFGHFMGEGGRGHRGGHRGGRFGGGRIFGHGDLKLVLLALIAEQPRHGYDLIRTIEEKFDGAYAPSPGAVYPTLTMLEEMGYTSAEAGEGNKRLYSITTDGSAFLDENKAAVKAVMARMASAAKMYSRMAVPMAIREAMHTLKHALFAHGAPWTAAEARRVQDIIRRAADEIVDGASQK